MSSTADSVSKSTTQSASFTRSTRDEAEQSKRVVTSAVDSVAALVDEVDAMASNIQVMNEDTQQSTSEINDLGVQIATAAEEQSAVTEEVNRNMVAIQEMVNQLSNSSPVYRNGKIVFECHYGFLFLLTLSISVLCLPYLINPWVLWR